MLKQWALFSHPSKRQGLVPLRMSGPLVSAGQVFVEGMSGCLSLSMKDHVGHKNVRVTFQAHGHMLRRTLRGPRGVMPILFTEAWRDPGKASVCQKVEDAVNEQFPGQIGCTSSLNHKMAACPGCPLYTPPTPSPRSNNYCFIISCASHRPCSQVSLSA